MVSGDTSGRSPFLTRRLDSIGIARFVALISPSERCQFAVAGVEPYKLAFVELGPGHNQYNGPLRWHPELLASTCGKRRKCPILK
jgi:hypothetical protein